MENHQKNRFDDFKTVIPEIKTALAKGDLVLRASPGAGKTTIVPPLLLDESWLGGKKIVMLEPRRLAARAAAEWMASQRDEKVGETIGYRVRLETKVGRSTRLEIVTEGVFTRMIQSDPSLEEYGLVIFDEVHERNLQTDLGLAFCLEARDTFRPDLRILVMSATFDTKPVADLLGAPTISREIRGFPVDVRYAAPPDAYRWATFAAETVHRLALDALGDVLVFLPGVARINGTVEALRRAGLPKDVKVRPLHGSLPLREQRLAIEPSPQGERKVVLATSIAETSLTIEGVRVVIDAGWRRRPSFDPVSGLSRLETARISKAEADQRAGRAGRVAPGLCVRLWSEREQARLMDRPRPEILDADLTALTLELAAWGASAPAKLPWLDPPSAATVAEARRLLRRLAAIDEKGRITTAGRRMLKLGVEPRLARMILKSVELDLAPLACDLAALLEERDILIGDSGRPPSDLRRRLDVLRGIGFQSGGARADGGRVNQVKRQSADYFRKLRLGGKANHSGDDTERAGLVLSFAFPDRIGMRRPDDAHRFLLANGRGARLRETDPLRGEEMIVAAALDKGESEADVFLAAPLKKIDFEATYSDQFETKDEVVWDDIGDKVVSKRTIRFDALIIKEETTKPPDDANIADVLVEALKTERFDALPWTKRIRSLVGRVDFLRHHDPDGQWPDMSPDALRVNLDQWLGPFLTGITRRSQIDETLLMNALKSWLPPHGIRELDVLAPERIEVPSGRSLALDYEGPDAPVLEVRVQEMFGSTRTPAVLKGRVPVTLRLLSPSNRPAQTTSDLAGFWKNSYHLVRKDLRGRYPKHDWPEDPSNAAPSRGGLKRSKRR